MADPWGAIIGTAGGVIVGVVGAWATLRSGAVTAQAKRDETAAHREEAKEDFTLAGLKLLIDGNHEEIGNLRERVAILQTNEDRLRLERDEARDIIREWQEKYAELQKTERDERHELRNKWDDDRAKHHLREIELMDSISKLKEELGSLRASQIQKDLAQAMKEADCEQKIKELSLRVCAGLERIEALEASRPQPAESVPGERGDSPPLIPSDGC